VSFDLGAYRREMLAHCLWMAQSDPAYAKWAAKSYEDGSHGALKGLADRVERDIACGRVEKANADRN
jgi:hypothetical protein